MARFTKEQQKIGHETLRDKGRKKRRERDNEKLHEPIDDVPDDYREAYDNRLREEGHFEDN